MVGHLSQIMFLFSTRDNQIDYFYNSYQFSSIFYVTGSPSSSLLDYIHEDDKSRFIADRDYSINMITDFFSEVRVKSNSEIFRWLRFRARVHRLCQGFVIWVGICDDISDLVKARCELSAEKSVIATLEAVLSVTFDVTVYLDQEYRISRDTPQLRHFFSIHSGTLKGVNLIDLMNPELNSGILRSFLRNISLSRQTAKLCIAITHRKARLICELYASALPWPLEGSLLVGIKVSDAFNLEKPCPREEIEIRSLNDSEFLLFSTDRTKAGRNKQSLMHVDLRGTVFELATFVASKVNASLQEKLLTKCSAGKFDEAFSYLSNSKNGNLDILGNQCLSIHTKAIMKVFKFLALAVHEFPCDIDKAVKLLQRAYARVVHIQKYIDDQNIDVIYCISLTKLAILYPQSFETGSKNLLILNSVLKSSLNEDSGRFQWYEIVCIEYGISRHAADNTNEALHWLKKGLDHLNESNNYSEIALQLRSIFLYNLLALTDDVTYNTELQIVISENPEVHFQTCCYEIASA
jgi:hypothetical protein